MSPGRRRGLLRLGFIVAVIGAVAVGATATHRLAGSNVRAAGLAPAPEPPPASPAPSDSPAAPSDPDPQWDAFARAQGVVLYLPAEHPVGILYHEASFHDALRLRPLGHVVRNANHWGFHTTPATPGPGYIVMSSRGRGTPATSAADVVLRPSTPVRSPVTGRVVAVVPYHLYCRYPDLEVRIKPKGGGPLRVVLIHLRNVPVEPGDAVFATLSVIGYPRVFPFRSQVDDYLRGGNPHVHIEIAKPDPTRRPTC